MNAPHAHLYTGVPALHFPEELPEQTKAPQNQASGSLPGSSVLQRQHPCEQGGRWALLVTHLLQRLLQLIALQRKLTQLSNNHNTIRAATAHSTPSWMSMILGFWSEDLPGSRMGRAERWRTLFWTPRQEPSLTLSMLF